MVVCFSKNSKRKINISRESLAKLFKNLRPAICWERSFLNFKTFSQFFNHWSIVFWLRCYFCQLNEFVDRRLSHSSCFSFPGIIKKIAISKNFISKISKILPLKNLIMFVEHFPSLEKMVQRYCITDPIIMIMINRMNLEWLTSSWRAESSLA